MFSQTSRQLYLADTIVQFNSNLLLFVSSHWNCVILTDGTYDIENKSYNIPYRMLI